MCVVSRGKEEGGSTGVQLCSPLPERDINKVISEPVGLIKSDAMLYCYEDWNPEQPVDARGMSDGTLRFIAIVVALLAVHLIVYCLSKRWIMACILLVLRSWLIC